MTISDLARDAPCPVLIVRTAGPGADEDASESADSGDESDPLDLHRILLPVTGADTDRHAAEIAFALAADRDMVVDVVHVVRGGDRRARLSDDEAIQEAQQVGEDLVGKIAELGHTLGATVHTEVVVADHDEESIVDRAESNVDLIVLARSQAQVSQRASVGHRVDYVVRHAPCRWWLSATPDTPTRCGFMRHLIAPSHRLVDEPAPIGADVVGAVQRRQREMVRPPRP